MLAVMYTVRVQSGRSCRVPRYKYIVRGAPGGGMRVCLGRPTEPPEPPRRRRQRRHSEASIQHPREHVAFPHMTRRSAHLFSPRSRLSASSRIATLSSACLRALQRAAASAASGRTPRHGGHPQEDGHSGRRRRRQVRLRRVLCRHHFYGACPPASATPCPRRLAAPSSPCFAGHLDRVRRAA